MIRCVTPAYKNIHWICQNSDENDVPVILIVKSSWAKDIALAQFNKDGYAPKEIKLASIRRWMIDGGELHPSIMHVGYDGQARFDEGRTRSIVAHEKGFDDYPVATTQRHALAFKDHWGSLASARLNFDFSACWDSIDSAIILGNP